TGGLAIYRGRAAAPGGETIALCAPDLIMLGRAEVDFWGFSLAVLGDIDGDNCDELAVGAVNETLTMQSQGVVHVIFGAGAACASASPRRVALVSNLAYSQGGYSVAGGM